MPSIYDTKASNGFHKSESTQISSSITSKMDQLTSTEEVVVGNVACVDEDVPDTSESHSKLFPNSLPTGTIDELLVALRTGNKPRVTNLIEEGRYNVNHRFSDSTTPLINACDTRRENIALWLLDHGAIAKKLTIPKLLSPMHVAAREGLLSVVRRIAKDEPKLLDAADANGNTPMHYAASSGAVSVMQLLALEGASRSAPNAQGRSPLLLLVRSQTTNDVQKAIGLHYLLSFREWRTSEILNARNVARKKSTSLECALTYAVRHGYVNTVRALLSAGDVLDITYEHTREIAPLELVNNALNSARTYASKYSKNPNESSEESDIEAGTTVQPAFTFGMDLSNVRQYKYWSKHWKDLSQLDYIQPTVQEYCDTHNLTTSDIFNDAVLAVHRKETGRRKKKGSHGNNQQVRAGNIVTFNGRRNYRNIPEGFFDTVEPEDAEEDPKLAVAAYEVIQGMLQRQVEAKRAPELSESELLALFEDNKSKQPKSKSKKSSKTSSKDDKKLAQTNEDAQKLIKPPAAGKDADDTIEAAKRTPRLRPTAPEFSVPSLKNKTMSDDLTNSKSNSGHDSINDTDSVEQFIGNDKDWVVVGAVKPRVNEPEVHVHTRKPQQKSGRTKVVSKPKSSKTKEIYSNQTNKANTAMTVTEKGSSKVVPIKSTLKSTLPSSSWAKGLSNQPLASVKVDLRETEAKAATSLDAQQKSLQEPAVQPNRNQSTQVERNTVDAATTTADQVVPHPPVSSQLPTNLYSQLIQQLNDKYPELGQADISLELLLGLKLESATENQLIIAAQIAQRIADTLHRQANPVCEETNKTNVQSEHKQKAANVGKNTSIQQQPDSVLSSTMPLEIVHGTDVINTCETAGSNVPSIADNQDMSRATSASRKDPSHTKKAGNVRSPISQSLHSTDKAVTIETNCSNNNTTSPAEQSSSFPSEPIEVAQDSVATTKSSSWAALTANSSPEHASGTSGKLLVVSSLPQKPTNRNSKHTSRSTRKPDFRRSHADKKLSGQKTRNKSEAEPSKKPLGPVKKGLIAAARAAAVAENS